MKRITNPMQEVAVDILTRISFVKNIVELDEIFKYVYEKYQLHDDPFTHLPCTNKEYGELCEEYGRQKFEEYWGYPCDY